MRDKLINRAPQIPIIEEIDGWQCVVGAENIALRSESGFAYAYPAIWTDDPTWDIRHLRVRRSDNYDLICKLSDIWAD